MRIPGPFPLVQRQRWSRVIPDSIRDLLHLGHAQVPLRLVVVGRDPRLFEEPEHLIPPVLQATEQVCAPCLCAISSAVRQDEGMGFFAL